MADKHTLGPWATPRPSVHVGPPWRHFIPTFIVEANLSEPAKRRYIAVVIGEANALLIAAAPELLEALTAMVAHTQELREAWERGALSEHDGRGGTRSNRNVDYLTQARAAIAKATSPQTQ